MKNTLEMSLQAGRIEKPRLFVTMIILSGYFVITWIGLSDYLISISLNYVLGFLAIVFCWNGAEKKSGISMYIIVALLGIIFYDRLPSKFVLYLSIGLCVFSFMEGIAGKAGLFSIICIFLMSPLFEYFTNVFGFPIRLELTKLAGTILNWFDTGFRVEGNMIVRGSREYGVDPACIGLHMLNSSMLTGMILMGIFQRRLKKKLSIWGLTVVIFGVFLLNLFSNLVRIVCLVEFQIPPENRMHGGVGLGCFVLYVLIPTVFLVKFLVSRFGRLYEWRSITKAHGISQWSIHFLLLIMFFIVVPAGRNKSMTSDIAVGAVQMSGYKMERLPDAIVKLSAHGGLVYLKPIFAFYSPDHQPSLCWKGSGFEFTTLEKCSVDGETFYTSWLQKGKDKLLTAWWYDNGHNSTIDQMAWRWDSFKNNRRWALVNVTANSKEELLKQIRAVKRANPCRMLFKL